MTGSPPARRRPAHAGRLAAAPLLVLLACTGPAPPAPAPAPAPSPASEAQVSGLSALSERYESLQREVADRNRELGELAARYQQESGELPPAAGIGLSDDQRALLGRLAADERLELGSLAQELLERDRRIADLHAQVQELERKLPHRVVARDGDRHERLAVQFLTGQRGLTTGQAWELISGLRLEEQLLAGFTVWFHHDGRTFGTWVSRGSAPIGPRELQERIRGELLAERDEAVGRAQAMEAEVARLERRRLQLEREIAALDGESAGLARRLDEARARAGGLEAGGRYAFGTRAELAAAGVIRGSGGRTRIGSLDAAELRLLEPGRDLTFDAASLGLERIRKVTLLPRDLEKDRDYSLAWLADRTIARLRFRDARVRGLTVVIVFE